MKKLIYQIFTLATLMLFVSGCDKYLEYEFTNVLDLDYIKTNPVYAEGLLINAYGDLPNMPDVNQDAATDNAVINQSNNIYSNISTGAWRSDYNPFSVWSNAYRTIGYINRFLAIVDEVEWSYESEWQNREFAKRLKGEAFALRAYYFNQLLEHHAGVAKDGVFRGFVIVNDVITINDEWENMQRNTYKECFDQIMNDVDSALVYLPDVYANASADHPNQSDFNRVYGTHFVGRINGNITRIIRARTMLHAASPAFAQNNAVTWEEVALAAAEAINKIGSISIMNNQRTEYYRNINNPDIIWRRASQTNSTVLETNNFPPSLFGNGRINPTQNLVDAFPAINGYPITNPASNFNPTNPYNNRDPRLGRYIIHHGARMKFFPINTIDDPQDGINARPQFSTRTGYYLLKHINPDVNLTPGSVTGQLRFHTLIRATELFLIFAEAANEAWGPDDDGGTGISARQVIQRIRQTAGIRQPDQYLASISSTEQMRDLIRNERRLELSFEGFRAKDLRRWADTEKIREVARGTIDGGKTFIDVEERIMPDHTIYFPIPYQEERKGIIQNQGW